MEYFEEEALSPSPLFLKCWLRPFDGIFVMKIGNAFPGRSNLSLQLRETISKENAHGQISECSFTPSSTVEKKM